MPRTTVEPRATHSNRIKSRCDHRVVLAHDAMDRDGSARHDAGGSRARCDEQHATRGAHVWYGISYSNHLAVVEMRSPNDQVLVL